MAASSVIGLTSFSGSSGLRFRASGSRLPAAGNRADHAEPMAEPEADGKRLVARDAHGAPLFSEFDWTEDATARIQRVPAGFMRDRTQERIEELAREQGNRQIDLERVETGIELGLRMMAEMVSQNDADSGEERRDEQAAAAQCPVARGRDVGARTSHREEPLNEVSKMTELAAMRMLLTPQEGSGEK